MITITKARQKASLESEWRKVDIAHYGFQLVGDLPDFYLHTDFVVYTRKI